MPLLEIVSEPDRRSADEVIAYLEKLRRMIQYLGASDCKLQEGSMRADVNLSIREVGQTGFGTRTEMKNLNSFKAIRRAIENAGASGGASGGRKTGDSGNAPLGRQQRGFLCDALQRGRKGLPVLSGPDLPPVLISDEWIERVRRRLPEFQEEKADGMSASISCPNMTLAF